MYHASKWALEGPSQSLSLEVKQMGIRVTLVEPMSYTTGMGGASASGASAKRSQPLPAYDSARQATAKWRGP